MKRMNLDLTAARRIDCSPADFNLDLTLESGQVFLWRRASDGWWTGLLSPDGCPVKIRQTADALEYRSPDERAADRMRDYFRLAFPLADLAAAWSQTGGPEIGRALTAYAGLRVIRQDPWQCLISFMASPASPIHRIRRSLQRLSQELGEPLESFADADFWAFPAPDVLAATPREVYDRCGLGFRGPRIAASSALVRDRGGAAWIRSLRDEPYLTARRELVALPGIGEKVADCICLFSLDKHEATPIDVHMARVARALFNGPPSSLARRPYQAMADAFRERFGPSAGWAQQYLYFEQIQKRGIWDDALGKHRKGARLEDQAP